jgi:hypothetical protein
MDQMEWHNHISTSSHHLEKGSIVIQVNLLRHLDNRTHRISKTTTLRHHISINLISSPLDTHMPKGMDMGTHLLSLCTMDPMATCTTTRLLLNSSITTVDLLHPNL